MKKLRNFFHEDAGPVAVEYAVMLALIIGVCIGSITLVGGGTFNFWNNNQNQLEGAFAS